MTLLQFSNQMEEIFEHYARDLNIETENYKEKVLRTIEHDGSLQANSDLLIKRALENIDESSVDWTFLAARLYLHRLYEEAAQNRNYDPKRKYGSFYELISQLTNKGIYTSNLIDKYSKEEIHHFGKMLQPERDLLFTYPGIFTLASRYLAVDYDNNTLE